MPTHCKGFTWLQAPAHGVFLVWDKENVGFRAHSTLCPQDLGCTHTHTSCTRTHTPLLLRRVRHRMGWELPSCPIAMSCHLLTAQSHCKPLGQQDRAEGDPAAPGAAPLPGHCRLRGDRAGGEGSHPDTALYCKPTREQPSPMALLEPRLSHAHPAASFLLPSGPALAPSRGSLGKLCTREEAEKMFLRHY